MTAISTREGGRLVAVLFVLGWIFAIMGGMNYISEIASLLFSTLCWLISVIIFISNRVKNHQAKSLSIQSDWEEFDGDSKTEFTALPDPAEFELDIPL